jgi:cysteine protease ATG4
MNNIDIGRYKRIVQYFWDPEPKNDEGPGSQLWCLGSQYVTQDEDFVLLDPAAASNETTAQTSLEAETETQQKNNQTSSDEPSTDNQSSNKPPAGKRLDTTATTTLGWPKAFLDDFESKVWMTYRSNFPTIAKSEDQNASQTMSLGVRLRSHLIEGFTSDTGWGCMIRSGQSLLANAIFVSQLGRGRAYSHDFHVITSRTFEC